MDVIVGREGLAGLLRNYGGTEGARVDGMTVLSYWAHTEGVSPEELVARKGLTLQGILELKRWVKENPNAPWVLRYREWQAKQQADFARSEMLENSRCG